MQSVKENLLDVVKNLPNSTTYDAAIEAILIRARFDAGKEEIKNSKGVSHEEVLRHYLRKILASEMQFP